MLIDSEPLWHDAEVDVLGALGVPVARVGTRQTKGMVVEEVTRYWHERFPWTGPSTDDVAIQVVGAVEALMVERGRLQPGALAALDDCRRRGLRLALASSSHYRYIHLALDHFDLNGRFDVIRSAQDEAFGKPHPAVFLSAAADLGAAPRSCLVLEDAPAGVIAAKAARMSCIAVPVPEERAKPAIALADAVLSTLEQLDESVWAEVGAALERPA